MIFQPRASAIKLAMVCKMPPPWPSASDKQRDEVGRCPGRERQFAKYVAFPNQRSTFDEDNPFVLFSGDGDFRSLVEAVQRRGVRVTVVSTISSRPPMIADELRRQADVFTDLVELQPKVWKMPLVRRGTTC